MKIAILSESPADDEAVHILIEGVAGLPLERIAVPWLKTRGWPSLRDVLPKVVQYVYYETDARGLVVMADSDRTPIHRGGPDCAAACDAKCRMCKLQEVAGRARSHLTAVPGRIALEVAIGLAIPSIEAWYRCGIDHQVSEAAWDRALQHDEYPYDSRRLKLAVYRTDRPTIEAAKRSAVAEARRLVDSGELPRLERLFPTGFGSLANNVRSWSS